MDREPAYRAVYRVIGEHPPRSSVDYEAAAENARIWRAVKAALDTIEGDPCADIPDAPVPEPYRPAPGTRARHGRKESPNVYLHTEDDLKGLCIGRLDRPEYAALVVEALNFALQARWYNDAVRGATRTGINLGLSPYPEIMDVYRDATKLLAGRNAGQPELLHQELRRMRGALDRAIRAAEDMAEEGEGSG